MPSDIDMRKLRIALRKGASPWKVVVYDSAESALFLSEEPLQVDDEYRHVISLESQDVMEIEWLGSEWVYRDEVSDDALTRGRTHVKYDKVRLGKMTPITGSAQRSGYLRLYMGWVTGDAVPWSDGDKRKGLKITHLKGKIRSKFDLSKLFVQDMTPMDERDPTPQDSEKSKDKTEKKQKGEPDLN